MCVLVHVCTFILVHACTVHVCAGVLELMQNIPLLSEMDVSFTSIDL